MASSPNGSRRHLRAAIAACVFGSIGLIVPAVSAQDSAVPIDVINADDLLIDTNPADLADLVPLAGVQQLGFNDVEAHLLRGMTTPVTANEYAFGDDISGVPVIRPSGTSLIGTGSAQIRFDVRPDMPASGTMTQDTVYLESGGGIVPGQDVTLLWFEFDSPVDLATGLAINEGVVFSRPNVDYWMSDFAGDTWEGGYLMPTVTYFPDPFAVSAFRFDGSGFAMEEFPGFVYRTGNMMFVGVDSAYLAQDGPLTELGYGLHLHWAEAPFTPGFVSTYPERAGRTPETFPLIRPNVVFSPDTYCCYVEPVEATTTTEAPPETTEAPTTTQSPTTTVAAAETTAAPAETTLPEDGNLESASFRRWVPIIVTIFGVSILAGGFWIYYKTRERGRPGTDTGGGEEEPDDDDPRDTPVPPVYGEETEHSSCDWSVYFHDGANWIPLRKAHFQKHECCVYRIKVRTRIRSHVQAAKARQDAGDGRLYIPEYNFAWQGLNLNGNASTRSGPRGRLDWMQGLGNPTDQSGLAPDEEFYQIGQGDEPPEVAVHLEHSEITRVEVKLEAGCPDYRNTYKGWGSSTLDVLATQECTNDAPAAECPVELNAFGWSWGEVWGDLNYWFGDFIGSDIDEIEGLMRRRAELDPVDREDAAMEHRLKPLWDGHDHEMRDRATYEEHGGDTNTSVVDDDEFVMWITSEYELDSAQLVPVHVWPTTERVTTHIDSDITHAIDLDGSMIPVNCDSNGCGGHGDCGCRPEFKIKFDAAVTTIKVADETFRIHRDPTAADRREPPVPGGYKSWKLV